MRTKFLPYIFVFGLILFMSIQLIRGQFKEIVDYNGSTFGAIFLAFFLGIVAVVIYLFISELKKWKK